MMPAAPKGATDEDGHGIVLDASVALKLVLAEELSEHAAALVAEKVRAHQPVYGPPTLLSEALSALHKRTRYHDPAKALTYEDAEQALADLLSLGIDLVSPPELYVRTLSFARARGLTRTYDAMHVVLAQLLGVELWTDDRNLLNTLDGAAPWVRWIGNYPLVRPSNAGG
jgi:predicted nucleic acid-binding protein